MKNKFYIGQKVQCIDTNGARYLSKKKIYTVDRIISSDCVKLKEIQSSHSYYMTRFVCAKTNFYKDVLNEKKI